MTQLPSNRPVEGGIPHAKRYNVPAIIMPVIFMALLSANHIFTQWTFSRQANTARLVNLADEQDLLANEVNTLAATLLTPSVDGDREQRQQQLTTLLDDWQNAHQSLLADTGSSAVNELHTGLNTLYEDITAAGRCLADPQSNAACADRPQSYVATITTRTDAFRSGIERIAAQYEIEETNGVTQATTVSWILFIVTIIVLSLIGYFVLRPAGIRQNETLNQLAQSRLSLQASVGEAEARSLELQTAADVSAQISTILEVNALLQEVSDLTKSRLNLYHAHIYLLNPSGDTLILAAGAGNIGRQMVAETRIITLATPDSIVATAARSRQSMMINDVRTAETFLPHPLLPDTRSELAIPLVARGQLLGVMDLQSDQEAFFTKNKNSVLELLAVQVAIAIGNARLYEASEQVAFRERTLGLIDRELQGTFNVDEILDVTTRELANALNLSPSNLEVKLSGKNPNTKTWGGYLDKISTAEMRRLALDDSKEDTVVRSTTTQFTQPIMMRGTRIGTIIVKPSDGANLNTEDKELVQDTARLVAQALDQSRSIEEIRRSEEAARAAQQFLDSIIENIPNMVFVKEAQNLTYVSLNKAGEDLLGIPRKKLLGKSDLDVFPTHQAKEFMNVDREVLSTGKMLDIPEETIKQADGTVRYLHTKKIPLRDSNGNVRFLLGISDDITDRKQAETALVESERRYRQIVEEATDVVYTIDPAGFFTYVSPSAKRLTGFDPDALLGKHFTELLPKGEGWRKQLIEFYVNQTAQKIPQTTLKFPILTSQGERRWVEQQVTITLNGDAVVGLQSVTRDVTDRVLQDEAIEQARVRSELLGLVNAALSQAATEDEILTAVSVVVIERNITYAMLAYVESDDHYRINGAEITALYSGFGEPLSLDTLPSRTLPLEYQRLTSDWLDGIQTPVYIENTETLSEPQRTYFQSEGIASIVSIPLRTGNDWQALIYFVWLEPQSFPVEFRDLVESMIPTAASVVASRRAYLQMQLAREQAEQRSVNLEAVAQVSATATTILETEELLKTVANLTRDRFRFYHAHIYLLDDGGEKLVLAAGAGEPGDLMKARGHFIPYDRQNSQAARSRRAVIANDVTLAVEFLPNPLLPETRSELALPMIVADKLVGVLDVQHNVVDRFNTEDVRVLTALTDQVAVAVENSRAFLEQQKTAERLREVDRLKSQFLANMSHELRTPLNSIIGYAEVLLDGIDGDLNEEATEDVVAIHSGGKHLLTIINDILDLAKIEAGQMSIDPRPVNILDVVQEVMETCNILARNKGLELKTHLRDEIPLVSGDAIRLKQIILNLVNNAIKFTNAGSVTVDMGTEHNMLKVRVIDTGMGMTAQEMKGLFQQFNQVDNSPTRRAGGTGLGLVISRHLVTMHGGVVDVESEKGIGSTFWFTVPIHVPEPVAS